MPCVNFLLASVILSKIGFFNGIIDISFALLLPLSKNNNINFIKNISF